MKRKNRNSQDFLYNYSDILVAVAIFIVAALLIFWRVQVIMAYPSTFVTKDTVVATEENIDNLETIDDHKDEIYLDDKLIQETTLTIPSGSMEGAIQALVDAELFDSIDEFNKIADSYDLDPNDIKAGEFTFAKGSTKDDIVQKVIAYR